MKKGSRTQSVQHVAGRTTLKEVFLTDASIGSIHWPNLSAYLLDTGASHSSGVAGLIGFSQFGVKRLHFDFNNYILSWEM
jgi:hypothetical protein